MKRTLVICALFLLCGVAGAQNNTVILLDSSGSMNEGWKNVAKMDAAKSALKEVLKQVPHDTQIGLITFRGWLFPLGPRDDNKLLQIIDGISPDGNTPLGRFTNDVADALLEQKKKQFGYGNYQLLILTDGEATDSPDWDSFMPDICRRGIRVDVIGVKMASAHSMKKYASSYRNADDPEALKKATAQILAEVSIPTTAENADLSGLDPEVAREIIKAFSRSVNATYPIGEKPPDANPVAVSTDAGNTNSGASASAPMPIGEKLVLCVGVVLILIVLIIIGGSVSSSNRHRRYY